MRLVALAAVVLVVLIAVSPRRADACDCGLEPVVAPPDGATGVPLGVEIVVDTGPRQFGGSTPFYVLEGPGGPVEIVVERVVEQWSYWIDLVRPVAPLEPSTAYVLTDQGDGYPAVMTTFTTGAEIDTTAPAAATVGDLVLAHASLSPTTGFSCGDEYYFVDLPIEIPADAVAVDLLVNDAIGRTHYVISAEKIAWGLTSWNSACGIAIPLVAGDHVCFEVRSRDLAGNLGGAVQRCATVAACADIGDDNDDFSPDLTDCDPQPSNGGCSTSTPSAGALLVLVFVAGLRRRRAVAAAAIGVIAMLVAPRPADACSCGPVAQFYPADGATDVPTNVVMVVADQPRDPSYELTLQGPSGPVPIEIVLVVDEGAKVELIRPLQPLEPATEYTLTYFEPLTTFQTGPGADAIPPEPAELGQLTVARAGTVQGSSCGDEFTYIDLPITAPADAVAVDIYVDTLDGRMHYIVPAARITWGLSSWNSGCEMRIPLEPGEGPCFEVRSRDQAGNLGEPVRRCGMVTHCADIPDAESFDGDLSDCEPYVEPEPSPPESGCSTSSSSSTSVLVIVLALAGLRRRSARRRPGGSSFGS